MCVCEYYLKWDSCDQTEDIYNNNTLLLLVCVLSFLPSTHPPLLFVNSTFFLFGFLILPLFLSSRLLLYCPCSSLSFLFFFCAPFIFSFPPRSLSSSLFLSFLPSFFSFFTDWWRHGLTSSWNEMMWGATLPSLRPPFLFSSCLRPCITVKWHSAFSLVFSGTFITDLLLRCTVSLSSV